MVTFRVADERAVQLCRQWAAWAADLARLFRLRRATISRLAAKANRAEIAEIANVRQSFFNLAIFCIDGVNGPI